MVTDDLFSEPKDGEVEIGASSTKRIIKSDQFYTKYFTPTGKEFFIFSKIGDYIKGILLGSRDNSHINRTKSWRIEVWEARQNGVKLNIKKHTVKGISAEIVHIEEFFANRQLQRYITKHELANKCVRIVFIGRKKSGFGGHSVKVYRVFVDKGIYETKESECYEPKTRKRKSRK